MLGMLDYLWALKYFLERRARAISACLNLFFLNLLDVSVPEQCRSNRVQPCPSRIMPLSFCIADTNQFSRQ